LPNSPRHELIVISELSPQLLACNMAHV
jgi:hypothetical protein